MRNAMWIGSGCLAAVIGAGALLLGQPEARAVDESQSTAVSCQKDIAAWNELSGGTPAPSRAVAKTMLSAAVRCGHRETTQDRLLVGAS